MTQQVLDLKVKELQLFPIQIILNQKFNSIKKVKSLQMPVLFLHGTSDNVVKYYHSKALYNAAPEPKKIFLVPKGNHFNIYQPNNYSYLKAIAKFMDIEQHFNF